MGTVTGSPVSANGYTFYPVSIPGYSAGWIAGEFFARVTIATPTRTATAGPPTVTRTATAAAPTLTRTPTSPAQATATRVPGGFIAGDTARTTASVNLRSGPSTGSSVVTVVPPNTTATITGTGVVSGSNTFYPVTIAGVGSGWIAGQYLALVSGSGPNPTATSRRRVAGESARRCTSPPISTSAPVPVRAIQSAVLRPKGTSALITGASVQSGSMTWYPLNVDGIGAGWASGTYLSLTPTVQGPLLPTFDDPTGTATLEPTSTSTGAPPSETPLPTATATIVDVLAPTEVAPAAETLEIEPTEEQQVADLAPPADAPEADTPPVETLALPIARIQRSPDSQPGQLLVDNDPSTVWFANGAGQPLAMFVLDLGQVSVFSQIQWQTGESGISGTLYLQVSSDNVEWLDLDPTFAYATEDGWIALDAPVSAQFIRFVFVNDAAAEWLGGISEVRVLP